MFFLTGANLTSGYQPTHLSVSEKWTWDANRAPETALHSLPFHNERFPGIFKFIQRNIHLLKKQLRNNQNTEGGKANILRVLSFIVFHAIIHLSSSLFTSYSTHSEGGKIHRNHRFTMTTHVGTSMSEVRLQLHNILLPPHHSQMQRTAR